MLAKAPENSEAEVRHLFILWGMWTAGFATGYFYFRPVFPAVGRCYLTPRGDGDDYWAKVVSRAEWGVVLQGQPSGAESYLGYKNFLKGASYADCATIIWTATQLKEERVKREQKNRRK